MKKLIPMLAALLGLVSPAQAASTQSDLLDSLIAASSNRPVGETVVEIARLLSKKDIVIPSPNTNVKGSSAQFLTGKDNEGNVWLYVYSDATHVTKALPNGTPIFTMNFSELKKIIDANQHFRGIYINSSYPVPRELFGKFFSVVK